MKKIYILIFMLCQTITLASCVSSHQNVFMGKAKICPTQLNWSIEELIGIALVEFNKAGGNSDSNIFSDVTIRQMDCKIFVSISPEPRLVGNDFGIVISAENGKVLELVPGM